jgi:hypothetical protein
MKIRDPVTYDSLHRKDTMVSTYNCTINEKSITPDPLDINEINEDLSTSPTRQRFSGFSTNNSNILSKKIKHEHVTSNSDVQSDLLRTTYQKNFKHPTGTTLDYQVPDFPNSSFTRIKKPLPPHLPTTQERTGGYGLSQGKYEVTGSLTGPYKLSQALASDKKVLEQSHPTVQDILRRRNPAQYGDVPHGFATSTYEHKDRTTRGL